MLIDDAIKEARCAGRLKPVYPVAPWAPEARAFLMCEPLWRLLEAGKADTDEKVRQRWAKLEGAMQFFVEGGHMTDRLLKQLCPYKYEHWELVNKKPRPSLRVFGRFAKPDVFIGTHARQRNLLGGKWSQEFEMEKLECEDHWETAGLPIVPFPGAFTDTPQFHYGRYITENAARTLMALS
jgi:hypothetical protein